MRHKELLPIISFTILQTINKNINSDSDGDLLRKLCEDNKEIIELQTEKDFIEKVISDYESIFTSNKSKTN